MWVAKCLNTWQTPHGIWLMFICGVIVVQIKYVCCTNWCPYKDSRGSGTLKPVLWAFGFREMCQVECILHFLWTLRKELLCICAAVWGRAGGWVPEQWCSDSQWVLFPYTERTLRFLRCCHQLFSHLRHQSLNCFTEKCFCMYLV